MKKNLTALALGALALSSLTTQAQITLDGVINANEIGNGVNLYQSLGAFTTPHIGTAGFGNQGLLRLYAATSSTKLYVGIAGTIEPGNNDFQLYMDLPGRTGVVAGTPLPNVAGNGTVFATSATDPDKTIGGTKMDMDVDAAIALTGAGDIQAAVFTNATTAVAKSIGGGAAILTDGTPNTTSGATGTYALFSGTQVSYMSTPSMDITSNPGNTNGGGAGSTAVEFQFNRSSMGITAAASIVHLMVAYVSTDAYWSSDVIPEIPGNGNNNLGFHPDFTALAGTQSATFNAVLSSRAADEAVVAMSIFPNPSHGQSTVSYRVLDRTEPVSIKVTDLVGRQVKTLLNQAQGVGIHELNFNDRDLAAGIYQVTVQVGDKTATRKLVVTE